MKLATGAMAVALAMVALIAIPACANKDVASQGGQLTVQGDIVLPAEGNISELDQPMMYDFVNGCAGYHTDMVSMVNHEWDFIIATKNEPTKIDVAFLHGNEGDETINLFLPALSSNPREYVFKDHDEQEKFYAALSSDVGQDKVRKYSENGVDFYVIPFDYKLVGSNPTTYGTVDLSWAWEDFQVGVLRKKIDAGYGYPTELIREACDLEAIKRVGHIDFNDGFWDNVNYRSNIKVRKVSAPDSFCAITPYVARLVAGYGDPIDTWKINGNYLNMDADDLNDYLLQNGYESIDSAIANGEYLSDAEVKGLNFERQ